jgi:hypothetical protein
MDNPFKSVGDKLHDQIEDIKRDVMLHVEIKLRIKAMKDNLSVLKDLDPAHSEQYQEIQDVIEGGIEKG